MTRASQRRLLRRVAAARTAVLAAALAAVAMTPAARAQGPCLEREAFLSRLETYYGERVSARGLTSSGTVIELIESPGGATWTIIVTLPNGVSCGVVAGEWWEAVAPPKPGEPS